MPRTYVSEYLKSLRETVKGRIFNLEDYLFEKAGKFDFGGVIKNENLVSNDKEALVHATAYQAVWCRNLRELFDEAYKYNSRFENFIDIGSGKGKACIYAHQKFSFQKIIGIEFSEPLVKIANQNKLRAESINIDFLHLDATTYQLPPADTIVFLFNPFDGIVLEKFIRNNLCHFQQHNSVIAYANDAQRKSLNILGFETIFRNQTRKISLHKYLSHQAA